jgi:two-component system response regulator AtoC
VCLGELARQVVERAHREAGYARFAGVSRDVSDTASLVPTDDAAPHNEGLLLVTGGDSVLTFPIQRDEITIGRAPDCDVVLAHESLSRRHVKLRLTPTITVEDLGSRNGTKLRGAPVEPGTPAPLTVGETFQVGRFHFLVARTRRLPSVAASTHAESLEVIDPTNVKPFVRDLAASPLNILVLGETGVGKEVLAQTIHDLSQRTGAFIRANCAAMAPSLIESELFGHEKAAFTGATTTRVGLLEAAQHGTFFLDEVGELPESVQVKMLRVIETREIMRIGSVKPILLDIRFVAATNRELALEVAAGRFRSDLFYRLDGATLVIPPLREHKERIVPLAKQFATAVGASASALDAGVLAKLEAHDWPGNVRELKAVVERAAILAAGGPVQLKHVAITRVESRTTTAVTPVSAEEADERQRILAALDACAGNQTRAAKLLGVSRATLVNKLSIHRIQRPRK